MNENFNRHTSTWVSFSYLTFALSFIMLAGGIFFLPLDAWAKGYLAMGLVMLVQTTVNVTKTLRDNSESEKLIRKVEDAKTEKLLLDLNRGETA